MNKYILRTSLFWIVILAVVAGIWAYRSHQAKQPTAMKAPMSGEDAACSLWSTCSG